MKDTLLLDVECYWEYFYIGFKRISDNVRRGFEMSSRTPVGDQRESVAKYLHQYKTVGFNSLTYDLPIIWYWIEGADNTQLKKASDRIIKGNVKWWDVEDMLGIRIPWKIKQNHCDLIEPQPNPFASLKLLNGRLHGKQMQDLPLDPAAVPTHEQMDILNKYCLHSDLDATDNLINALEGPLDLRRAIGAKTGLNLMSKSDTQMGLALIKKSVEAKTGKKLYKGKAKPGATFRYKPPEYMSFETPVMRNLFERICNHDFVVNDKGKVGLPQWLSDEKTKLGYSTYSIGIGGLHSTESNRSVRASNSHALCDFDATSFYPNIIIESGLYPDAVGPVFLPIYEGIKDDRVRAKRAKDKVADKGGKIQLNGCFGSLGSPYSFVYAPHLLIAVTLTGQLVLLMLIEKMEAAGIEVVSGNTDGVVLNIQRDLWNGLDGYRPRPSLLTDIILEWEATTGFKLEGTEYKALYNQSVNSYFAIKPNGEHKRKGPIGNPWNKDPADFDIRGQLMKNPQMTICSDAALYKIKHGTPVEETIRASTDMREFVTVINAKDGAAWRDEYLGKVVRYYWSTDGDPILKVTNGNKVPKTDGAKECMLLPDDIPEDLDYDHYIAETEKILSEVGYYGDLLPAEKPIRLTIKNRAALSAAYATAI